MTPLKTLVKYHFHLAVWISIFLGIFAFLHPDWVMVDDEGLFGPLRNNLLFAVAYILLGQIGLWWTRYQKGGTLEAAVMGYTFLATAFGAKIYAEVNGLPVSPWFVAVLFYFAFAHVLYYIVCRPTPKPGEASEDDDP